MRAKRQYYSDREKALILELMDKGIPCYQASKKGKFVLYL